jgi:hypothetical protein
MVRAPEMSPVHASPSRADTNNCRFCFHSGTTTTNSGAICAMLHPSTQASFQKRMLAPLPISWKVEALKKATMTGSSVVGKGAQILPWSARLNHTHRSQSAQPKTLRSSNPRLPMSTGCYTLAQVTMHLPP